MYWRTYIYSKVITFLPNQALVIEIVSFVSNLVPYLEYLYLSVSGFVTNLTAPDKEFPSVGSLLST